ncbi:MAG: glycerophosphodiester phosphodiesterase [Spirochaetales bacterium]|nr:glycerophosphodiester phosphodiesterase [Leptospiraceae bacterium]MCP5482908.1 glycerophosphodiester phosphodiesterase [Spirochaetales bacterium]MCP5486973.1 glycerophosphodiester phosphodiesterase [Spirochaetales bacterium]
MRLLSHRGHHRHHIENTRAAFDAALNAGFAGLELDLRSLGDGTVVVFHDEDLWRLAGSRRLLHELDYSAAHQLFPQLLSLYEFVALYGRAALEINFEIKDGLATLQAALPLMRQCRNAIVSSFERDVVVEARSQGMRTAALFEDKAQLLAAPLGADFERVHLSCQLLPLFCGCAGLFTSQAVYFFTVNDPTQARYISQLEGVAGFFTDNSELLDLQRKPRARRRLRKVS